MQDANYPWFILVPDRENISELHQLDTNDRQQLIAESSNLSGIISKQFKADKINIAALGNLVPQLHVHVIVRYTTDAAWPSPVWGKHPAVPYGKEQLKQVISKLEQGLPDNFEFLL